MGVPRTSTAIEVGARGIDLWRLLRADIDAEVSKIEVALCGVDCVRFGVYSMT